jgi:hypothetical protein
MNSDDAGENYKLLLNIIHWLDGKVYLQPIGNRQLATGSRSWVFVAPSNNQIDGVLVRGFKL